MEAPANAIVLIGFMGAGKTTVGAVLAVRTRLPLFDTDAMVTAKLQKPITEIFARMGEESFRDEEALALASLPCVAAIVVTGGGAVLRPENVDAMRKLGTTVWLRATQETILARVAHFTDRPLLASDDPGRVVSEMLEKREPLYQQAADVVIETDGLSPEAVAEMILDRCPPVSTWKS